MTADEFKAWRERMSFNRVQAAEALGIGRNQPLRYEEEGVPIPHYITLACSAIEDGQSKEDMGLDFLQRAARERELTPEDFKDDAEYALRLDRPQGRMKEIVAVTIQRAGTRPFPSIHRYYVDWFDSNGLRDVPDEIERSLMNGLRSAIIAESRRMERSALGAAPAEMFFEDLTLLGIFTTDRSKALIDHWAYPLDLHEEFHGEASRS